MVHQPILVPFYALLWMNDFLFYGLVRKGRLIDPMESSLNAHGLLLLGYIKDIMHSETVDSLPNLGRMITAAIAAVPVDVLSQV
jgi:hypothetical protein